VNASGVDLLARARRVLPDVPGVTGTARGGVRLAGAGLPRLPLTLNYEDGCLSLSCAAAHRAVRPSPWDVVLLNGRLTASARLTLASSATRIGARADIVCSDGINLPARLESACNGLREAALLCRRGVDTRVAETGQQPADSRALPELLAEAGWSFVRRSPDRLVVDLRVSGQSLQAVIDSDGGSGANVRVPIGSFSRLSPVSRTALGVLLLTVSSGVRHVRGGAREDSGSAEVFINASLGAAPALDDVHHVLSAMSVAARLAAREARACVDERVAAAYLETRGWDGQSTRSQSQGG
jgi:hypothetical protein